MGQVISPRVRNMKRLETDGLPLFIIGAQRSGTTLLRLLLNAHPELGVPEEARFLMPLLNKQRIKSGFEGGDVLALVQYLRVSREYELWNYDRETFLSWLEKRSHVGLHELLDALYGSWVTSEGKPYWGDKSLFFRRIDILAELFPGATFIHVVRDGRDVFNSWRGMDPSRNDAATIALDWRCKLSLIERAFRALPEKRTHTLRYEDLIADPEVSLRGVCEAVGLDYDPAMLEFHNKSQQYIGAHHSNLIFAPIDAGNREKWREALMPRDVRAFEVVARSTLQRHGYPLSVTRPGVGARALAYGHLVGGAVGRAVEVIWDAAKRRHALKTGSNPQGIAVGELPREHR